MSSSRNSRGSVCRLGVVIAVLVCKLLLVAGTDESRPSLSSCARRGRARFSKVGCSIQVREQNVHFPSSLGSLPREKSWQRIRARSTTMNRFFFANSSDPTRPNPTNRPNHHARPKRWRHRISGSTNTLIMQNCACAKVSRVYAAVCA